MSAETTEKRGQGKRRKDILDSSLIRLVELDNVIFTCVVDPEGEIIGSKGDIDGNKLRSYGPMCATMFAAAKETSERSDSKGLEITISDNDPAGQIYILGLDRDYILVARLEEGRDHEEIQRNIQDVGEFLTNNKRWMKHQLISTLKRKYK